MKRMNTIRAAFAIFLIAGMAAACTSKKAPEQEHFGTEPVNWPTFEGPGDFAKSLNRVMGIMALHRLDGRKVDMDWIDPAFREQVCLTVTLNNHCVG